MYTNEIFFGREIHARLKELLRVYIKQKTFLSIGNNLCE